jgi:hypothetical protein
MIMRKALLVGLVLLVSGMAALGQHLGELTANYSYTHYVPVDNLPTANLNGGGSQSFILRAFFGLKAEVEGYASQNINFNFPPGSIRCPSGCTGTAQANLFTGNSGPQIKIRIKRVQPFFEGLVGGAWRRIVILTTSRMSTLGLSALSLAWWKVAPFGSPKKSLSSMPSASYRNI